MIIKMQLHYGSANYIIFDNASEVTYSIGTEERPPQSCLEVDQFYYKGGHILNRISCLIDGEAKNLWFDGEAYICNQDGKTIQKVSAVEAEFRNYIGTAQAV